MNEESEKAVLPVTADGQPYAAYKPKLEIIGENVHRRLAGTTEIDPVAKALNPDTTKQLRQEDGSLIVTDNVSNIGKPPAVEIAFYEQSENPHKDITLPEGYEMVRFDVRRGFTPTGKEAAEQESKRISFLEKLEAERNPQEKSEKVSFTVPQFHALYSLAGASSGWWPLDDKGWDSAALFDSCEMYALKNKDGIPCGFGAIEKNVEKDEENGRPNVNKITFVGLSPSLHGQGVGGKFFDALNAKAWEGADLVKLDTVPELDVMKGKGGGSASTLYEKRGYDLVGKEVCTPDDPSHFNQFNLPDYYKDNPRYTTEHLEGRLKAMFSAKQAQVGG